MTLIRTYPLDVGAEEESRAHSSFTGGGRGVEMVLDDTSDTMFSASFIVWYILNISSLRVASSSDSCIMEF